MYNVYNKKFHSALTIDKNLDITCCIYLCWFQRVRGASRRCRIVRVRVRMKRRSFFFCKFYKYV